MAFRKMTIVLVPEDTDRVVRFRLPWLFLVLALFAVLSSLGYLGFVLRDYHVLKARMPRLAELERESVQRDRQFVYLARRVDQIALKMGELKDFDRKLKTMVNLETGDDSDRFRGVGGSDPALLRPNYAMAKSNQDLVRLLHQSLDNLNREVSVGKQDKAELHKFLENQKILLASTPSVWPTKGWLSSRFGYRISPFTNEREFHRGIDVSSRMNAPIVAPADGVVSSLSSDHGYGKIMTVHHGYGLVTRYAHLQKALVKKGQYVKRGETVALVGNSGRSTGPHLHYEVLLNGVPVDPLRYIID